ncbi:MAG: TylF/MycF/NovP-related O-methyltransferase [Phycisphaerae bacterium]
MQSYLNQEAQNAPAHLQPLPACNHRGWTQRILDVVPQPVAKRLRVWKRARQNWQAVQGGERLVPEETLRAKYVEAVQFLAGALGGAGNVGDYLEFGVYNGSSLACAYHATQRAGAGHMRLFGFDSFEGLPDNAHDQDGGLWHATQFCMAEANARAYLRDHGVTFDRTHLIKGWFDDTCSPTTLAKHQIRQVGLLMIDCDLYSSAKTALTFAGPLLQQTSIILFDDWRSADLHVRNMGEKKAFDEFLADNPQFTAEPFGDYGSASQCFVVRRAGRTT